MIVKFKTDDPKEILRLSKSLDMACCLFDIKGIWTKWKHSEEEPSKEEIFKAIDNVFDENNININELID